jgi:hypothetical protein
MRTCAAAGAALQTSAAKATRANFFNIAFFLFGADICARQSGRRRDVPRRLAIYRSPRAIRDSADAAPVWLIPAGSRPGAPARQERPGQRGRFLGFRNRPNVIGHSRPPEDATMLAAIIDTAAFLFLLLIVVLVFGVTVALLAPPVGRPPRQGFYAVLLYLAFELAALFCAISIVAWIGASAALSILLALVIAAVVFVPQLVARIPVPAAVTNVLNRK